MWSTAGETRETSSTISEAQLTALYDERNAHRRRLHRINQIVEDLQRAAADLAEECDHWKLVGDERKADRGRAQAEQMRLCCLRLTAALRGPRLPADGAGVAPWQPPGAPRGTGTARVGPWAGA